MNRSSVRSASLAILLTMNGCGGLLSSSGNSNGEPGLKVAEAALAGGAPQIALAVSDNFLSKSPNNIHAKEIKAEALGLLGERDLAAAIFRELLAKDPNSVRANTGLGRITLTQDPAAAETMFLAVLRLDPGNLTALNNLGIARDQQGRHAEAQNSYRQALAVDPDLDSAQVNLALSLSMSGHAPDAVELLRARATRSDAPARIRHDYAVALAMSGRRAEAERVLGATLSADEIRQVLDGASGVRTRVARDQRDDDRIPPDVVQVPEVTAPLTQVSRAGPAGSAVTIAAVRTQAPEATRPVAAMGASAVQIPAPMSIAATAVAPMSIAATVVAPTRVQPMTVATMAVAPVAIASTAGPAPMVVRPRPADRDVEPPFVQPVGPVAAAASNPTPLSSPVRALDTLMSAFAPPAGGDDPAMVTMPRPLQVPARAAPTSASGVSRAQPLSIAPPPAAEPRAQPPALQPAPIAMVPSRPAGVALAFAAPSEPPRPRAVTASTGRDAAAPAPGVRFDQAGHDQAGHDQPGYDQTGRAVQFAATVSEESAQALWRALLRRFPADLSQREPMMIRVELGGKVVWRVRTEGFHTPQEARDLCARMRAGGQDCFVPRG